jgi:hypothetical protein
MSNVNENNNELIPETTEEISAPVTVKDTSFTKEDLEKLQEVVQIESVKQDLEYQTTELHKQQKSLLASIKDYNDSDYIQEKLKNYTMEQLETLLKDETVVESFFIDPMTGKPAEFNIDFPNREREIEFKRGLLTYFKATDEAFDRIDQEYEQLEQATKEFDENVADSIAALSDNVLGYIQYMTDIANKMENVYEQKKLLKSLKYIRSGYDMSIYKEVLIEHPSVSEKCVDELSNEKVLTDIGRRYATKLEKNKVHVSLIDFASDIQSGKKSFEEMVLIRNEQYIVPDLFIYSLIRFFAMAKWDDPDIKKAHASIALVIRKLIKNEFTDEVKAKVVAAIVEYLGMFKTNE